MAFLLLLHQKMRLQRKENELTLKQLRYSSKVDRMQKKVDKRQKYYDKLRKQIQRQADTYKSQANVYFNNMAGLGTNSVNLYNPYGSNAATMGMLQNLSKEEIAEALKQTSGGQFDSSILDKPDILNLIKNGGLQTATKDGKTIYYGWQGEIDASKLHDVDPAKVNQAASALQQMAQVRVNQMQQYTAQMKTNYDNNVSIWLQAAEDELDMQEQAEMDMLAEEQSDMEAEKNSIEVQLQRVQEEKKNVEQALGNAIQDSAPKFGLA